MLYLTNPKSSLPTLSQLLENFRYISGYTININKSVMMPLNLAAEKMLLKSIPFLWNSEKIVYLGLDIPSKLEDTYSLNYSPLLKKVIRDLERWISLPLSLIGRINCIQMNVLPKSLYLFQTLSISIPQKFFL